MSRFIAVIHAWHVESKGFQSKELNAKDRQAAEGEAAVMAMREQGACRNSDYHIVEIADRECLLPRRLTWAERITGVLANQQRSN